MPIKSEAMKPKETAAKSLNEMSKAYFTVLSPPPLIAIDISLPARSPTKHQVVLIGILE